jgi:hypothetical protein
VTVRSFPAGARPVTCRLLVAAMAIAATALAGCGLGEGEERSGGAELRVTRDFGRQELATARRDTIREGETVMRFLQGERRVETRYGGGFVQSIDGLAGGGSGGREDWFYFVNGIEASVGAAERNLSPGDVVQWDHRNWEGAMRVPAIVGAYPEPFVHGSEGKRIPTRVECEDERSAACGEVARRLEDAGVTATRAPLGASAGPEVLRVVVAKGAAARGVKAIAGLDEGPEASGVFARFADGGQTLELLDERGDVARVERAGTGLVAARAPEEQAIVWMVTGVDDAGVEAAARALDPRGLRNAFAVSASPRGVVRLPVKREGGA